MSSRPSLTLGREDTARHSPFFALRVDPARAVARRAAAVHQSSEHRASERDSPHPLFRGVALAQRVGDSKRRPPTIISSCAASPDTTSKSTVLSAFTKTVGLRQIQRRVGSARDRRFRSTRLLKLRKQERALWTPCAHPVLNSIGSEWPAVRSHPQARTSPPLASLRRHRGVRRLGGLRRQTQHSAQRSASPATGGWRDLGDGQPMRVPQLRPHDGASVMKLGPSGSTWCPCRCMRPVCVARQGAPTGGAV